MVQFICEVALSRWLVYNLALTPESVTHFWGWKQVILHDKYKRCSEICHLLREFEVIYN